MRLPSGDPFPLPIILDINEDEKMGITGVRSVSLIYEGTEVGELLPTDIYRCDRQKTAQKLFGTSERRHSGVDHYLSTKEYFVGGEVRLKQRATLDISRFEWTPAEVRDEIQKRGWRSVVGFQTRNVPHRAHEYLQRVALEHVDGLLIQPLIGRKQRGDYTPEAIMAGYRALIDGFYPQQRVLLAVLTTAMRYAGPREAIFHAIIRRNYGCTHFIVGRDHAGVGDYYGKYEAHQLTKKFEGELGIQIMRLHGPYHCKICDGIVTEQTCPHAITEPDAVTEISGTDMRAMLSGGKNPETHLMRNEIVKAVEGLPLFTTESLE
jgi:sulfate adenylyltransferase